MPPAETFCFRDLFDLRIVKMVYVSIRNCRFFKSKPPTGQITGEFFILYAIARIVCEIFREPDVGVEPIIGLSRGTFYSLICLVLGIAFVIFAKAKAKKAALKS